MVFQEQFANNRIRYRFRYPDTALYMRPYIKAVQGDEYDILASEEYIEKQRPYFTECAENAYVEYKALIELTSKFLLPRRTCIFHAVAFCWKGYAWLITGPSGAGKTTQYKNWKIMYGDEVQMICGDMPLLEWREDGSIWVHPTPWNGKERIQGNVSAPLAGIVTLEQYKMNSIERMVPNVSGMSLLPQMAIRPETEEEILLMADMLNGLLQACPVWKLKNRGDAASALMTANAFDEYLKNAGEKKTINETKGTQAHEVTDMKYYTRKGIVMTSVGEQQVLVSAVSLHDQVPYVTNINDTTATLWERMVHGATKDELTACIMEEYEVENEAAVREDIDRLLRQLSEQNYITFE